MVTLQTFLFLEKECKSLFLALNYFFDIFEFTSEFQNSHIEARFIKPGLIRLLDVSYPASDRVLKAFLPRRQPCGIKGRKGGIKVAFVYAYYALHGWKDGEFISWDLFESGF